MSKMQLYVAVTHGTGDGMQPSVYLRRTLDQIKELAVELSSYEDDDDEDWLAKAMDVSRKMIGSWDGKDELTVDYFDGNLGHLTLTTAELPSDEDMP